MADPGTTGTGTGGGTTPLWQEWMKQALTNGKLKKDGNITEVLRARLDALFVKLKEELNTGEARETKGLCADMDQLVKRRMGNEDASLKVLCKGMVGVRYFVSGLKTQNKKVQVEQNIEDADWYPRCLVGMVALSEIYGDHCDLGRVINLFQTQMDAELKGHLNKGSSSAHSSYFDKCKNITPEDITLGKSILGSEIKTWVQEDKGRAKAYETEKKEYDRLKTKAPAAPGLIAPKNSSALRVGGVMHDADSLCKSSAGSERTSDERKQQLQKNTGSMAKFFGMNVGTTQGSSGNASNPFDALVDENLKLEQNTLENVLKTAFDASTGEVNTNKINDVVKNITNASHQVQAENCIHQKKDNGKDPKPLCDRLRCMKYLWTQTDPPSGQAGGTTTTKDFWEEKVRALWKELSDEMVQANGTEAGIEDCEEVSNGNNGSGKRDATHSEKTACNYLYAGFNKLYEGPTPEAATTSARTTSSSPTGDVLKDNPSFRQTMGCFLLHSYAKYMKDKAICNIDKGIEKAFKLGDELSDGTANANCNTSSGKGPCVPCQWDKNNKLDSCLQNIRIIGTTGSEETAKKKVEDIFKEGNKDKNIPPMLSNINTMSTLCDHMECIASHLNSPSAQSTASTFWDATGEVHRLWQVLSTAMITEGETEQDDCGQMEDSTGTARLPTTPEKKACNYLHAGFTKLKKLSSSIKNDGTNYPTLHRDPSFAQTVGCFLLHSYAKQMEDKANCLVESGIKKAFETAGKDLKGGQCKWDDEEYDDCQITTIATSGTTKTKVKEKLNAVQSQITNTLTPTMKDMNETKSLCEKLQCAAGKWFNEHSKHNSGTPTPTKTWCEFWDGAVKNGLQNMFTAIQTTGTTNNTAVCEQFGDENPQSVERKACNHITAGLQHIKEISGNDQLLHQAVDCIALNMYADQIIKKSEDSCPIDKDKIEEMFKKWNNDNSCSGSGNNNCFKCTRHKDFSGCHLSVSDALVETTKNASCNENDKKNVQTQMNKFLNEDKKSPSQFISQVNSTLSTITDITKSSFCTQLQCAAKQYQAKSKNGGTPSWDELWEETGEVKLLWAELSTAMTNTNGNKDNGVQCDKMDDNGSGTGATGTGRTATKPEKKACQYLTLGFNKLKELPDSTTSQTIDDKILSKDPLLRQTVGCILLKEYAKKMEKESKCVINSGLKKAFETAGKSLIGGQCKWDDDDYGKCKISTTNTSGNTTQTAVKDKLTQVKDNIETTAKEILPKINEMKNLCEYIRCAGPKWFKNHSNVNSGTTKNTWCDFWGEEGVKPTLKAMFDNVAQNGIDKSKQTNSICNDFGDENPQSVERKACNHITAGLDYINTITGDTTTQNGNKDDDKFFKQSMMCAALNLYATKIREESNKFCPIDESKIKEMFAAGNGNKGSSCSISGGSVGNNNNCFTCERKEDFKDCDLLVDKELIGTSQPPDPNCNDNEENKKVQEKMNKLLQADLKMQPTLSTINKMDDNFCTQLQCAAKKWNSIKKKNLNPTWDDIESGAKDELTELIKQMTVGQTKSEITKYCNDKEWDNFGHKEKQTNKAACLLFAAGLKHIYTHGNGRVNGPSFGQTMGCLFLKEYAKQLQTMANKKKKGDSWVHPHCSIEDGINHAFGKSSEIMQDTSPCKDTNGTNSCFVCIQKKDDYKNCSIGTDKVQNKVEPLLQSEQSHMEKTLENTVCPILLTDLLTPFLPLAPVSIGLSAMAYYLWKYFGPLGKGGARFRRSPAEIPGPSVQEQVLDHADEGASHEYRLVKERKPRSAPTRTKRSGPVNRRTIIEIHFEVLDECQKGDTQLNQKDFLELLVQEFMGSKFMEEEQVPKEEVLMEGVLMEGVPMESVPMEGVPNLGSGLLV
ncbi:SICAvar, type I [Plasmodium knowlesi strain H]|uniref:SICAvar, type I n=3 Tax=Plasmodium knowlesi TaxID=5850 RepID=A0A679KSI7_PLAKH|nr:SICAvar, type I [Plasmodium knowlesi strain H]OTN68195.1 SICAvar type I [Plasmodium knowlesi]CAA9987124.1 SICAvar, type I [Plasmodium knowlesi strain H]SBO25690.1 SICAvar, type I [Plasmodium knowlesi strain H]VVS76598.1 SICAvar, type I [Plasmodium knowlesi strain H]